MTAPSEIVLKNMGGKNPHIDVSDNKIKCVIGIKEHSACTSVLISKHSHW